MNFKPDRRPMRHTSCRSADLPGDPRLRPLAYVRDPQGFVHDQAELASNWPLWSFDWPSGYVAGTNPGPLMVFEEADARDAFMEECWDRTRRGLDTYLYLGRVLPNGETFNTRDATTKAWMADNLAPYFQAGLTGIFMDYFSGPPASVIARMNAADFRAFGKRFGGNQVPYDPTGLDGAVNPQVPSERLDQTSLRACAWYAAAGEIETIGDPGGLWTFDRAKTEVRYGWDARLYPDVKDAIAKIRNLRSRGYIVDLDVAAQPEVELEILKGGRHGE